MYYLDQKEHCSEQTIGYSSLDGNHDEEESSNKPESSFLNDGLFHLLCYKILKLRLPFEFDTTFLN